MSRRKPLLPLWRPHPYPASPATSRPVEKGRQGAPWEPPREGVGSPQGRRATVVVVSYSGKEINAKLVYYGAGLSGKTTNLEAIYEAVPDATRKLVLKGADALVFVADSEVGKMEENKESLANLRANLAEYGLTLESIPWVIQYNKRDLPNVYTVDELNAELNPGHVPFFEAVASEGKGVFETFRGVSHLLMEKVTRDLRRSPNASSRSGSSAAEEPAPVAPPASRAPEPP